jgi:putative membrane protein
MMGWYGHGGFGTSWMLMGAVWLLVLLALGWLVLRLVSGRHADQTDSTGQTRTALELLDRRFALGEIDTDTYRARRALLLSGHEVTQ